MDRARFSFIAHSTHTHCNPVSAAKVERLIGMLGLTSASRAVDIGCGKAELLIRLSERFGCRGTGVDRGGPFADAATDAARARAPGLVTVVHADAKDFVRSQREGGYDAALCLGASHALGEVKSTLTELARLCAPGGHVLLGEGYWKKPPEQAYLDTFGGSAGEVTTHAGNVRHGVNAGLVHVFSAVASEDDWDEYEGQYLRNVELFLAAHPDDPDAEAMRARIRAWNTAYLTWGRETMGFGMYLFRKP